MLNEAGGRTDDVRMLIRTLAFYVHRGCPLEWHEPPVRGSEGTSHDSRRDISFQIGVPGAFDAVHWELMKEF